MSRTSIVTLEVGRGRESLFDGNSSPDAVDALGNESRFMQALERGQLTLLVVRYQTRVLQNRQDLTSSVNLGSAEKRARTANAP